MNLLEMDNRDFKAVVDREVRGDLDEQTTKELRTPEVNQRWYQALAEMKQSVESQLASKKSDLAKMAGTSQFPELQREYHKWRGGALRFRSGLDSRLNEAKVIRTEIFRTQYPDVIVEERNLALQELKHLRNAIDRHRINVTAEFDPNEFDLELWAEIEK